MNSRELFDRVVSATSHIEDFQRAYSDCEQILREYSINHCAYMRDIKVFNSETGSFEVRKLPCGKCLYCRDTKRNEWVTRMWLHTKYGFKYCYFVTLDYAPISQYDLIPERLLDAGWYLDSFNSKKKLAYHPCLVRIEHLQLFIRQLRDDLRLADRDFVISYYSASEYGKRFGRPHHHIIIWSNSPLYLSDMQEAWTVRFGRRFQSMYPIGRVDFHDLNQNGTICSAGVQIDGQRYSAKNAFKYVCKYVTKCSYNDYRPYLISQMFQKDIPDLIASKFNIPTYKKLCSIFTKRIHNTQLFKSKLYEYTNKLSDYSDEDYYSVYIHLLTDDYKTFKQLFKPFNSVSSLYSIGKIYLENHVAELAYGRQEILDNDLGCLVFPSYFTRKIKEYLNGLSLYHSTAKGSTFIKGNRPAIYQDFKFAFNSLDFDRDCKKYVVPVSSSDLVGEKVSDYIHSEFCLRDSYSGLYYLIVARDNLLSLDDGSLFKIMPDLVVNSYAYNKHTRLYDLQEVIPISDYINTNLRKFDASYEYFVRYRNSSDLSKSFEDAAFRFMDCVFNTVGDSSSSKLLTFAEYAVSSAAARENDNYEKFNSKKL